MCVLIHKKGDLKICSNYRVIILLNATLKLYGQTLDDRLQCMLHNSLDEAQSGVQKNRSAHDHIFTMKEIIGKSRFKGKKALFTFTDLVKAFDKIPQEKVWEILKKDKC